MSTSKRETALAFLDAVVESDREKMVAVCRNDFVWTYVPTSMGMKPLAGNAAFAYLSTVIGANFKAGSLRYGVLRSLEGVDDVVLELNVKATALNGKPYDNFYVMWFEFRDGLISELREHTDTKYVDKVFSFGS